MKTLYKKLHLLLVLFAFLPFLRTNAQDAGATLLLSPKNLSCGSNNDVIKVIIFNFGSTTISNIPVNIYATGTSTFILSDTFKKSISAGNQDTLTFKTTVNSSGGGTWQYKIWTALSNDHNHSNDTIIGSITINSLPASPTGSAGSRCGAGPVTFKASSTAKGATIYWYPDTISATPFATGDSIIENLPATTTYYAAASSGSGFDSLSTTFSSTAIKIKGAMFNVRALHSLTVDSFDVSMLTKVDDTVYVYYKPGTYSGYQTNSSAWKFVGKAYIIPSAANSPTRAVIGGINLIAGNLYGFYVTLKTAVVVAKADFLATTSSSDSAYNSDMTISSGDALTGLFTGNTNGYEWDGRIYYSGGGCLSPYTAIKGTVNPVVKSLTLSQNKTSGGALNAGTLSNPDQVCVNDTLKYDIGVPANFQNSDYGSKWKLSFSLTTANGYATTNYAVIYPSSSTNGLISFFPKSTDGDSIYVLSVSATNLISGCDSIFTRYININPIIKPGFSVSNVCFGQAVTLTNTATPAGQLNYIWTFGDGTTISDALQNYQYGAPGTYTITQTAINPGCRASVSKSVTIYTSPTGSNFAVGTPFRGQFNGGDYPNPDYVCVGDTNTYLIVPPKGLSNSDYGTKWVITSISLKTFGGSGPYNKDTATKFPSGGKSGTFSFHPTKDADSLYILNITIKTLAGNCDSVISRYIQISVKPVVGYSFVNNCLGTPLTFKDTSTTPFFTSVSNWIWVFGDGDTSMLQNPSHSYAKAGTYIVKLTASSSEGCGNTVSKTAQQYPKPDIKFGQVIQCSGSATDFLDSSSISTGSIKSWNWNFGDGSTSSQKSPAHTYANPGTYTLSLAESSSFGCEDTLTKKMTILLSPVAGFNYKNACVGTSVSFSNTSTDPAGNPKYSWDFGTGSFTSTTINPVYTFNLNGKYDTRLVVTSGNGCTDTSYQVITPYPKPIVYIGYSGACVGEPIAFADTGINDGNSSYAWKYGDNATDQLTTDSTTHKYNSAGTYNVSLSVQNGEACIDSGKASIVISSIPKADFTTADVCFNRQPASFTNASTGTGTLKYVWNLGDNSKNVSTTNVTHTYSNSGTYNIQLITSNAAGCADTITKPININPVPAILPWAQNENHNVVTFVPQDTSIGKFEWHFGDPGNDSSSTKEPTFSYPSATGKYLVKLFVTSHLGCIAEKSDSIYISSSGIALQLNNLSGLQVFPNPSDGITHINYQLQSRSQVNIALYNLAGKKIAQLKEGLFEAGNYSDVFDAEKYNCPEGVYILKMKVNGEVYTTRIENMK